MKNSFEGQLMPEDKTERESFFDGHLSSDEKNIFSFFTRKIEGAENPEDENFWMEKLVPHLLEERFGDKLKKEGKEVIKEKEEGDKKGFVEHPRDYEWRKGEGKRDKESLTLFHSIREKGGRISSEKLVLDREQIKEIKKKLLSEIKSWKNA